MYIIHFKTFLIHPNSFLTNSFLNTYGKLTNVDISIITNRQNISIRRKIWNFYTFFMP